RQRGRRRLADFASDLVSDLVSPMVARQRLWSRGDGWRRLRQRRAGGESGYESENGGAKHGTHPIRSMWRVDRSVAVTVLEQLHRAAFTRVPVRLGDECALDPMIDLGCIPGLLNDLGFLGRVLRGGRRMRFLDLEGIERPGSRRDGSLCDDLRPARLL